MNSIKQCTQQVWEKQLFGSYAATTVLRVFYISRKAFVKGNELITAIERGAKSEK